MTNLKFRGISLDTGKWIYGYGVAVIPEHTVIIHKQAGHLMQHSLVKPETVGQFTGLLDKNWKEIYNKDILEWTAKFKDTNIPTPPKRGVVNYEVQGCVYHINYELNGKHYYKELNASYGDGVTYKMESVEIIGNIYENSSLLSKTE